MSRIRKTTQLLSPPTSAFASLKPGVTRHSACEPVAFFFRPYPPPFKLEHSPLPKLVPLMSNLSFQSLKSLFYCGLLACLLWLLIFALISFKVPLQLLQQWVWERRGNKCLETICCYQLEVSNRQVLMRRWEKVQRMGHYPEKGLSMHGRAGQTGILKAPGPWVKLRNVQSMGLQGVWSTQWAVNLTTSQLCCKYS